MAEEWRKEFERRALAAADAPKDAVLDGIETGSDEWAYSEYTSGSDSWVEVNWRGSDGKHGSRRWYSMAELICAMDVMDPEEEG